MQIVDFLNIEPQISFNSTSGHFEDLPENFLETISPQQNSGNNNGGGSGAGGGTQSSLAGINLGQLQHHHGQSGNGSGISRTSNTNNSHLVSLAPMSVTSGTTDGYLRFFFNSFIN